MSLSDVGLSQPDRLATLEARRGDYLLSIKKYAEIRNISTRTVWRQIARGEINVVQVSTRRKAIWASEAAKT